MEQLDLLEMLYCLVLPNWFRTSRIKWDWERINTLSPIKHKQKRQRHEELRVNMTDNLRTKWRSNGMNCAKKRNWSNNDLHHTTFWILINFWEYHQPSMPLSCLIYKSLKEEMDWFNGWMWDDWDWAWGETRCPFFISDMIIIIKPTSVWWNAVSNFLLPINFYITSHPYTNIFPLIGTTLFFFFGDQI